jgi:cardiolipin synthase
MPRRWLVSLLALVAGCQAPPARVATCDRDGRSLPRDMVIVRQVAADTAVEIAQHPCDSARIAAVDPLATLRSGVVARLRRCIVLGLCGEPGPIDPCRPMLDPAGLEAELAKMSGGGLQPADVRLYTDGPEAFAALDGLIDQASCRIDVLMYLWDPDPTGAGVAERLAAWAAAAPGRAVRVLVDGAGELFQGHPKEASAAGVERVVCWLSRQPGVEVIRTRNPFGHFDHRKLVVADGRWAWSGGRNFTAQDSGPSRDVSYTLGGPLAGEVADIFERFWREQGGAPGAPLPPPPPPPAANAGARLVQTGPLQRQLAGAVYAAIDSARHHVYVENPYLADDVMQTKLVQARRRGADVRVVLTLSDESPTVNRSNRTVANRLLKHGVRVYVYPGMLHAKSTAVDGVWAYVGTGNFDALSLRRNHELGLAVGAGPVIGELEERLFLEDFRPEWELTQPLPLRGQDLLAEPIAGTFL